MPTALAAVSEVRIRALQSRVRENGRWVGGQWEVGESGGRAMGGGWVGGVGQWKVGYVFYLWR